MRQFLRALLNAMSPILYTAEDTQAVDGFDYATIVVQIREVYGIERVYPVCEAATTFAQMKGQRTLTQRDIDHIKQLGYRVAVENPYPAFL